MNIQKVLARAKMNIYEFMSKIAQGWPRSSPQGKMAIAGFSPARTASTSPADDPEFLASFGGVPPSSPLGPSFKNLIVDHR